MSWLLAVVAARWRWRDSRLRVCTKHHSFRFCSICCWSWHHLSMVMLALNGGATEYERHVFSLLLYGGVRKKAREPGMVVGVAVFGENVFWLGRFILERKEARRCYMVSSKVSVFSLSSFPFDKRWPREGASLLISCSHPFFLLYSILQRGYYWGGFEAVVWVYVKLSWGLMLAQRKGVQWWIGGKWSSVGSSSLKWG